MGAPSLSLARSSQPQTLWGVPVLGRGLKPSRASDAAWARFVALLKVVLDTLVLAVLGLFWWFVSFHAKGGIMDLTRLVQDRGIRRYASV